MMHRRRNPIDRRGSTHPGIPRPGITLLEVVIAMAIFVMTLPALNALVLLGMQRAEETRILATASLMCRSKMAEIGSGSVPFASSDWSALDDPNWQWKADAGNASGVAGMQTVQVSVKLDNGSGVNYEQTLVQMVLDPAQRGSTQDRYLLDPTASTSAQSSSTTNSSGTAATGTAATGTGAAATGTGGAADRAQAERRRGRNGKNQSRRPAKTGGATGGATGGGSGGGAAATGMSAGGTAGATGGATGGGGGGGGGKTSGGGGKAAGGKGGG